MANVIQHRLRPSGDRRRRAAEEAFRTRQRRLNAAAREAAEPRDPASFTAVPGPQRDALLAYFDELTRLPWFERVGLPHPSDGRIERVTLARARASRWPPYLGFPGAAELHDRIHDLELDDGRERLFDVLPGVVGDLVWNRAGPLSLVVRWDVSKDAYLMALDRAYEIAFSDRLGEDSYGERFLAFYRAGHWPCDYVDEDGGSFRFVVL